MTEYAKVKISEDEEFELADVVVPAANDGDDGLPIAVAVPTGEHDDADVDDEEQNQKKAAPRFVRLTAPCGLPPQYRLVVKTTSHHDDDDDDADNHGGGLMEVIVPEPGVHEGQEFQAQIISLKPIMGRWNRGICDCGGHANLVLLSIFCPGVVFAAMMERLKMDWLAKPGPHKQTFVVVSTIWFIYVAMYFMNDLFVEGGSLAVFFYIPLVYLVYTQTKTRGALREKYQIPGSCAEDCCTVYWCAPCSAMQMHNHMKSSGDLPRPFKEVIEAELIEAEMIV